MHPAHANNMFTYCIASSVQASLISRINLLFDEYETVNSLLLYQKQGNQMLHKLTVLTWLLHQSDQKLYLNGLASSAYVTRFDNDDTMGTYNFRKLLRF